MKYHPIGDMKCPFCGQLNLVYKRPGLSGDVYRRRKGDSRCGVVAVLNFGHVGQWNPCMQGGQPAQPSAAGKR